MSTCNPMSWTTSGTTSSARKGRGLLRASELLCARVASPQVLWAPNLKEFNKCLDNTLGHIVWLLRMSCEGLDVEFIDPCRSLPTKHLLWFSDSVKFLHYATTPGSLPASTVAFRLLPLCWWAAQVLNTTEMHQERLSGRTRCKYFFSDISISAKPFCLDWCLRF